jgi:autotransporter-associated beta strand protein
VDNGGTATRLVLAAGNALTLSGTNTYSGGTVFNGGSAAVTLNNASALGTGPVIGNGGAGFTLPASTNFTFAAGNAITLNDGGLRLDAPSSNFGYLINGTISGTGPLFLTGAGTHVFNVANTATGTLSLGGVGPATLNANQAFTEYDFASANHVLAYGAGITQDISALISKRPGTTVRISVGAGNTVTWASSFGNGSNYVKVGNGTHTLGAENFLAAFIIGNANGSAACGTVVAAATNALGYGTLQAFAGDSGSTSQGAQLQLTGNITLNHTTLQLGGDGLSGINGVVRSTSGSNTINGDVTLSSSFTRTTISADTSATITFTGTIQGVARQLLLNSPGTKVFTGIISTSLTPTISNGTARFSGANTYTGNTTISGTGTAQAGSTSAFGTSAVTLSSASATIQTLVADGQNGKVTLASLTNTAGGTIRIGG